MYGLFKDYDIKDAILNRSVLDLTLDNALLKQKINFLHQDYNKRSEQAFGFAAQTLCIPTIAVASEVCGEIYPFTEVWVGACSFAPKEICSAIIECWCVPRAIMNQLDQYITGSDPLSSFDVVQGELHDFRSTDQFRIANKPVAPDKIWLCPARIWGTYADGREFLHAPVQKLAAKIRNLQNKGKSVNLPEKSVMLLLPALG